MGKKYEFTVESEMRVTTFLSDSVPMLSRAKADLLVKCGEVRVNGVKTKANAMLSVGDTVGVFVPDEVSGGEKSVPVVYEDENIVVFDKPKLAAYDALPQLYGAPLFSVHRLDTNTTGLIVFAKSEEVQAELSAAFKERRVKKIYEAVVLPAPHSDGETLTAYTKLDHSYNIASVREKSRSGYKTMITEYKVEERIGDAAVLRVYPHTGRSHQIRAHLAFIGSPIIGDKKYGLKDIRPPAGAPTSQMLAAVELTFYGLRGEIEYLNGKTFETDSGFDLSFLRAQ